MFILQITDNNSDKPTKSILYDYIESVISIIKDLSTFESFYFIDWLDYCEENFTENITVENFVDVITEKFEERENPYGELGIMICDKYRIHIFYCEDIDLDFSAAIERIYE